MSLFLFLQQERGPALSSGVLRSVRGRKEGCRWMTRLTRSDDPHSHLGPRVSMTAGEEVTHNEEMFNFSTEVRERSFTPRYTPTVRGGGFYSSQ